MPPGVTSDIYPEVPSKIPTGVLSGNILGVPSRISLEQQSSISSRFP